MPGVEKTFQMTDAQIERIRPIWEAADRAFRESSEYMIDIAKAIHKFAMSDRPQAEIKPEKPPFTEEEIEARRERQRERWRQASRRSYAKARAAQAQTLVTNEPVDPDLDALIADGAV